MVIEGGRVQFQLESNRLVLARARAVAVAFFAFHLFTTLFDLVHLDVPFFELYYGKIPMVILSVGILFFSKTAWMSRHISLYLCLLMLSLQLSIYIKSLQYGDYAPIASMVVFCCLFSAYFIPWRFGYHLAVTIGALLLVFHWFYGVASATDSLAVARGIVVVSAVCIATAFLAYYSASRRFCEWAERQRLLRYDEMFQQFGEHTSDIVFIWNPDFSIDYVSPSFERYTGWTVDELLTTSLKVSDVIKPEQREYYFERIKHVIDGQERKEDLTVIHRNGTEFQFEVVCSPILGPEGSVEKAIAVWRDITARSAKERSLQQLAIRDSLTRAFNQEYIQKLAISELGRVKETNHSLTFLYLDIDGHRKITEQNGLIAGDQVIVEVMERCREALGEDSVIGRFGGDSFLILLSGTAANDVEVLVPELISAIANKPVLFEDRLLPISACIGVAGSQPEQRATYEEILDACAKALYEAKRNGRGSYRIWDQTTD